MSFRFGKMITPYMTEVIPTDIMMRDCSWYREYCIWYYRSFRTIPRFYKKVSSNNSTVFTRDGRIVLEDGTLWRQR